MKAMALFLGLLFGSFLGVWGFQVNARLEALASENMELRLRDAARARVKDFHSGAVTVNSEAIAHASYDMGTPEAVLVAVRQQENGSPLWEFGHRGKTALISSCAPPAEWQAYEAARTLNKTVWRYALRDKASRHEVFKALGKAYTHEAHAKQWARNIERLYAE